MVMPRPKVTTSSDLSPSMSATMPNGACAVADQSEQRPNAGAAQSSRKAILRMEGVRRPLLRRLLALPRQQPADHEERAADEEQPHLELDLVAQQAHEQPHRQDDHADQLQETAEEDAHRRQAYREISGACGASTERRCRGGSHRR